MKRLILMGDIGAGKSTLIRSALTGQIHRAGGFVTRRVAENGHALGFDLASPAIWADPSAPSQRFLDLSEGIQPIDRVFAQFGASLLEAALDAPFCVADEFGGLELLVPEFYAGLINLLRSDVPTIGVLKTPDAARALSQKIPLGDEYAEKAAALRSMLEADGDTLLLPLSGWDDQHAIKTVQTWAEIHVRR